MVTLGGIAPKTGKDYITRLRFLLPNYDIDSNLTIEKIDDILRLEDLKRIKRTKYNTKKAMTDFKAGLNKFFDFLNSDFDKVFDEIESQEIKKIKESTKVAATDKEAIIRARVGQGSFRKSLIDYWGKCSVSGCRMNELLIASHIKPWRFSSNSERIDPYNGLLLLPNYDKLFDKGYISVDLNGRIIISRYLPDENISLLKLKGIPPINLEHHHVKYLKYHHEKCFI